MEFIFPCERDGIVMKAFYFSFLNGMLCYFTSSGERESLNSVLLVIFVTLSSQLYNISGIFTFRCCIATPGFIP